jgi:hypothetical protein
MDRESREDCGRWEWMARRGPVASQKEAGVSCGFLNYTALCRYKILVFHSKKLNCDLGQTLRTLSD